MCSDKHSVLCILKVCCMVHFVYYFRTINAGKTYLVNEDQAFAEMFCLHVIDIDNEPKEDTIVCTQHQPSEVST